MSVSFILREAGSNLRRHSFAALASVTTTAVCLLILGAFALFSMISQRFTLGLLRQSSVSVYVKTSVTRKEAMKLKRKIAYMPEVRSIIFVPKERAWAEEKQKYSYLPELDSMENPLGDEVHVTLAHPERSAEAAQKISGFKGVEKVSEAGEVIARLARLDRAVKAIGTAISGLLLFAAALLISNAIRLGVFSRRREIKIMMLVGATDRFIRMPFLLEGLLHGLAGAALACLILTVGARAFGDLLSHALPFLPLSPQGIPLGPLYGFLFAAGGALGLAGSYASVRRFLLRSVE